MTMQIKEELIFPNLSFVNSNEVLEYLATKLYEKNLVIEEYIESVLEREGEYPTGLPAKINVAIPHTDNKFVKETAIAVGILDSPVEFNSMENPNKKLKVNLVIMLAIKDSNKQINLLQSVISLIQNDSDVKNIIESSDKANTKNILSKYM